VAQKRVGVTEKMMTIVPAVEEALIIIEANTKKMIMKEMAEGTEDIQVGAVMMKTNPGAVKKQEHGVRKRVGVTEKMMTIILTAVEKVLAILEASMMKTMTKEAVQEVKGVLQAETTMDIIR
jgi:hypothetical protein